MYLVGAKYLSLTKNVFLLLKTKLDMLNNVYMVAFSILECYFYCQGLKTTKCTIMHPFLGYLATYCWLNIGQNTCWVILTQLVGQMFEPTHCVVLCNSTIV